MHQIVSFYRFIELNAAEIAEVQAGLDNLVSEIGLTGLVILAPEGLNGTVAAEDLSGLISFFEERFGEGDWRYKWSAHHKTPFKRLALKVREEIVTSGHAELVPDGSTRESHLSPEEWHEVLSSDEDIAIIDVRNNYEVQLGTFEGAINPKTDDFKEFPDYVEKSGIPKNKKVLMFCTGGIRCEKAYLEMKEAGYQDVKQLDGGILTYMEKYPEGHFKGECFVFDERVALDSKLKASTRYSLCPHCGDPASDLLECSLCSKPMKVCTSCQERHDRRSCSKNCAYHLRVRAAKSSESRSTLAVLTMFLAVSIVSFFGTKGNALAEDLTPSAVVEAALSKMKEVGNPSPIVDYVDWESSFHALPEARRKMMGVSSSSEMKEFYRKVLESPAAQMVAALEKKYRDKLSNMSNADAQEMISKLRARAEQQEQDVLKKIREGTFSITGSEVRGDTAIVRVAQTYLGKTKQDALSMIRKGEKWYFSSLSKTGLSK